MARLRGKKGLRAGKPKRDRESKRIIGYFAFRGMEAVCDGDGCIIAGSSEKMAQLIQRRLGQTNEGYAIRATSFSEIFSGMQQGGVYCFDEESYGRFLPMAQARGLPVKEADFSDPGPLGVHLVRVSTSLALSEDNDWIESTMTRNLWNE